MLMIFCFFGDVFMLQNHREHGNVQYAHVVGPPLILNACIGASFFLLVRVFPSIVTVHILKRKVQMNCKHFASDCKDCALVSS